MKKIGTLNQPLSEVIAGLGHLDSLVVADAGLPIMTGTQRIDLALTQGTPGFLETLRVILEEIIVERAIVAEEMLMVSEPLYEEVKNLLSGVPIETIPHEDFNQ